MDAAQKEMCLVVHVETQNDQATTQWSDGVGWCRNDRLRAAALLLCTSYTAVSLFSWHQVLVFNLPCSPICYFEVHLSRGLADNHLEHTSVDDIPAIYPA